MGPVPASPRGPVSPLFAGRAAELELLLADLDDVAGPDAADHGRVHLLGAEAGGGKTRLAREVTARVGDRTRVLRGGCVEASGAGLPYAPFVAALNAHTAAVPADELRDLLGDGVVHELARLVPSLGVPAPGDPELGRSRLFAAVLDLLALTATAERPVLLVVEDLHWADAGTRDLLAYLARQAPRHLLVLGTFRDTEVDEGHPLHPLLGELARVDGVTRTHLERLDERGTADQLEGILGRIPDPALVRTVHERGGGVPLFTEALVDGDGRLRSEVPASLRDLVLGAVRTLPRATRDLLDAAAIGGDRLSHRRLAAVTGLDDVAVTDAVRAAVAAQVLEVDGDGYAFRHQLIGRAVRDGVLPGDRIRLHRAHAEALADRPARAAGHWLGAGDAERALAAAWTAAAEAAWDERTRLLELVAAAWEQAPEAAAATGTDLAGVLTLAANAACWSAQTARGLDLIDRATAVAGTPSAAMLLERASFRDQSMAAGGLDDLRAAADVAPAGSPQRAEALGQLARALLARDRLEAAREVLPALREAAERSGAAEYALEADLVAAMLGDGDPLDDVADRAHRAGDVRLDLVATAARADVLLRGGEPARAADLATEGLLRTSSSGLSRYGGAVLAVLLTRARVAQGRWDEALDAVHHALVIDPAADGRARLLLEQGTVAVLRGDLATARQTLDSLDRFAPDPEAGLGPALARLRLEVAALDPGGAADLPRLHEAGLAALGTGPGGWALRASLSRIAADHRLDVTAAPGPPPPRDPVERALSEQVDAETDRADGERWRDLAGTWAGLGDVPRESYARYRAAAALLAADDRTAAGAELARAAELTAATGAEPLLGLVNQLARRARLRLGDDAARPHAEAATVPFRLTDRELDVLRLVAEGRTNGEIAQELFIATKTASVHVSNIMAKLGAANRGEAAATAHRLQLTDLRPAPNGPT